MDEYIFRLVQFVGESDLEITENEMMSLNESFDSVFPSYSNLINQKEELNKIVNKNSIAADLSTINFSIVFSDDLLKKIIEIFSKKNNEDFKLKTTCMNIIVIYFLIWYQKPSIENLEIILNLLLLIIPNNFDCKPKNEISDKSKEKNKKAILSNNIEYYCLYLYEPVLHSIEFCFKFYFTEKKNEIFDDIFLIFSSLFEKSPLNAKYIQNLIPEFLQVILKMYEIQIDAKIIPEEVLKYINFLNELFEKNLFEIFPDTSKSIIFIMNPYIPLLSKPILTLFMNYSEKITDNMHSSIISQLSESFFQLIESKPPYVYPTYYQNGEKIEDIISLLNEQPKIDFPFLFTDSKLEAKFNFIDSDKTFQDGLNVCHLLDLSEKPETKTIIRDEVYEILELIIKSLRDRGPSQIAIFSSLALKIQNYSPYFFDYCVIFTLFYKEMENDDIFYIFWNTIFDTILFDERVNCFKLNKDFLLFDKLRSLVIDILITMPNENKCKQSSSNLAEVVQSFSARPALIDEAIQRISSQLPLIPLSSLADSKFIQIISSLMLYFQSLNLNCEDKSLLGIIEDTRSSLFYLILKIFERNKNLYESLLWMSNMFFLPTFISFVFEKPVRPLVLNIIKNYIVTTNVSFYSGVLEKLEELCSLMASRLPRERETDLACDLLQIIIEFQVQRKREKIYYFKYLSKTLINSLDFLTNNTKESMRYLSSVILFLASSLEEMLEEPELEKISDTILRIENGKPSNSLFPFLTHLLAGKQISTTNPSFLIKQPRVLNLIIKCYINSDIYEQIFMNIKQLLSYSIFNVMNSVKVDFDKVLIRQINELKSDENNKKKVYLLLDLLDYVCNISCTKKTPMEIISLLYPIKNKWLSPFELLFARKITDIILFSSSLPDEWIPLGLLDYKDGCFIKVKGFNTNNMSRSFFIAAMVFLDQKSAQNRNHDQIFEIKDSEENGIVSFICSGNLIIKHFNSRITSTAKIDTPIPVGTWVPISFFVELPDDSDDEVSSSTKTSSSTSELFKMANSDQSSSSEKVGHSVRSYSFYNEIQYNCFVTPYIGSTKTRRVNYNWDKIAEGPILITIGNSEPSKEEETPAAFLSSIYFYDTSDVSDNTIFINKNHSSPSLSTPNSSPNSRLLSSIFKDVKDEEQNETINKQPFLSVSMIKGENGKISYALNSTVNVSGELNGKPINCHTTFCSALRDDDIVSFLLPLFKFIDYPMMNNNTLKEFPENLFALLSATLEAIREKQQVFKDKQGMLILSYLLNNSTSYVPSYSTYMQIYSILTSLIQPLQEDVISLFLLNHKNMVNSIPQNQLRLAKHWNRVLAEDYPNQIQSITPILVLIFEQFISDDPIVKQIRENLNKVVLKIAMLKLSKTDLLSLISLPLSSPVEFWDNIAIEVMSILSKLIKKENSAIYSLDSETLHYLTLINLYLQTASYETTIVILRKLLKLVIMMHKRNLIKATFLSLEAHIHMLMREMPSIFAEVNVILNVAHLSAEKNETSLLPLIFFLVSNSDDSSLFELFEYLNTVSFGSYQSKDQTSPFTSQDSLTSNSDNSYGPIQIQYPNLTLQSKFWLISATINAPRDIQNTVLKYIMNCPNRDDLDTAIIIDIVSKIKNSSSSLLREHLNIIAQSLVDQVNESNNDIEIPLSLTENNSSDRKISMDSSSFNSCVSLNNLDSSSHLLSQSSQKSLPSRIKSFFLLVSHFLFFRREHLSPALLHNFEMSIFARLEKDEKKSVKGYKKNKTKNITLNPNRYSQYGSMDLMNIKGNSPKNTFSDLRSFITSSSKIKKHRFSNFSRSESFHKLLLHPDELYKNSDSSNSTILFDKMMANPPKEMYKAVKNYANMLSISIANCGSYNTNNANLIMMKNDEENEPFNYCSRAFGLKFDKNGSLVDHEVAFKCLQLSEICVPIVQSFIPFDLMLSAFLVKKNRIAVEKHLSKLVLTPKQIKANKNTINLLSKYLSTRNKQEQFCSWIPNSYDELAVSMAFEEMEPRRSIAIEKREQKILHDYIEEIKLVRKEIKEALSIRRSSNVGQNEKSVNNNDNKIQKPSEYVYFIESKVIELHSQEMITNMMAEKLWKNIEQTMESALFNSP